MIVRVVACGIGIVVLVVSCAGERPVLVRADSLARQDAPVPALPDSLAVRGPGALEVWFTLARTDSATDGRQCVDRTIEIRHDSTHIAVPLLYTEETPRFVNDSTIEAVLYRSCRPLDRYRVDVRTGRPTPLRAR